MSSLSVWEMNVQAHMSSGAGGAASGGGLRALFTVEAEMIRARTYMQDKIYNILLQQQRLQPPLNENERRKFKDIVKRLEEALLRAAHSKAEYMNLETLESRLHGLIRRSQLNNRSQQ